MFTSWPRRIIFNLTPRIKCNRDRDAFNFEIFKPLPYKVKRSFVTTYLLYLIHMNRLIFVCYENRVVRSANAYIKYAGLLVTRSSLAVDVTWMLYDESGLFRAYASLLAKFCSENLTNFISTRYCTLVIFQL